MNQRWESEYLIARWLFGSEMLAEARGESPRRAPRDERADERRGRIARLVHRLASRSVARPRPEAASTPKDRAPAPGALVRHRGSEGY